MTRVLLSCSSFLAVLLVPRYIIHPTYGSAEMWTCGPMYRGLGRRKPPEFSEQMLRLLPHGDRCYLRLPAFFIKDEVAKCKQVGKVLVIWNASVQFLGAVWASFFVLCFEVCWVLLKYLHHCYRCSLSSNTQLLLLAGCHYLWKCTCIPADLFVTP